MTTIVELCAKNDLNPKVVRAKLRRAVKKGSLTHEHGEEWLATAAVCKVLGITAPKTPKTPKPAKAKKTAEAA